MNGLPLMVWTSSRTLCSTSENGMKSMSTSRPVSAFSLSRRSSFVKVSIPQSVWWITSTSRVPSSFCEMIRDRRALSSARPPAFRITCASPIPNPRKAPGCSLASIQVTTATGLAGGIGKSPLSKDAAKPAFASTS